MHKKSIPRSISAASLPRVAPVTAHLRASTASLGRAQLWRRTCDRNMFVNSIAKGDVDADTCALVVLHEMQYRNGSCIVLSDVFSNALFFNVILSVNIAVSNKAHCVRCTINFRIFRIEGNQHLELWLYIQYELEREASPRFGKPSAVRENFAAATGMCV